MGQITKLNASMYPATSLISFGRPRCAVVGAVRQSNRSLQNEIWECDCATAPAHLTLSQQLLFGMRPAATSALRPRNTSQLALSKGEKDKWYKWRHISPARLLRCLVSLKSSCRHRHIPKATVVDPVCAGRQGLMPAADCVVQKRTRVVYALPLFPRLHVE